MIKKFMTLVAMLLFIAVPFSAIANADIIPVEAPNSLLDKGVVSIAGSASYTSTSFENEENDLSVTVATPELHYFMWDKLAVGAVVNYTKYSQGKDRLSEYGIGPSIKMYFGSSKEMIPFVSISWLYNYAEAGPSNDVLIRGSNDTIITTAFVLGGGMNFMVADHVSLYPYVRYHVVNADDNIKPEPYTRFELGAGIGTFLF